MKKTGKRFLVTCLSAALFLGNIPSVNASELENGSAVAGMSVLINNFYASSSSPAEEILSYLNENTAVSEMPVEAVQPETVAAPL